MSPPCFLEMHISLFDIRKKKKGKQKKAYQNIGINDDFQKSYLLFSCITFFYRVQQQKYFWTLIALLSNNYIRISFREKYTSTFTLLKQRGKTGESILEHIINDDFRKSYLLISCNIFLSITTTRILLDTHCPFFTNYIRISFRDK